MSSASFLQKGIKSSARGALSILYSNSTVPQHFRLASTGALTGNHDFHTEFWHLPHIRISQRSKCQMMPTFLLQESPFPSCTKVTEGFALSHAGSTFHFYPWKAVVNAHLQTHLTKKQTKSVLGFRDFSLALLWSLERTRKGKRLKPPFYTNQHFNRFSTTKKPN